MLFFVYFYSSLIRALFFTMARMKDEEGAFVGDAAKLRDGPLVLERAEVERQLARFAAQCGGAEYIDPEVFASTLAVPGKPVAHLTQQRIRAVVETFTHRVLDAEAAGRTSRDAVQLALDHLARTHVEQTDVELLA